MQRLVILAPNWLGDAVMALPAIADVRRALPEAHLAIAARAAVAPLFQLVPGVDDTILLRAGASLRRIGAWRSIGAELSGRRFDAAVVLPNSIHAALVASRARIPERWGYASGIRRRWLTRSIARTARGHQIDDYRRLVATLGFANGTREPRITVPEAARSAADQRLEDAGWNRNAPLVALAPGAAYGGAKRWPPERFAELASALAGDGLESVLVGSAADAETAGEVRRAFERRVGSDAGLHDLTGRTDLPTLAGVFTRCRALVTNDSGAMHLAAAAGVPVTAIFGPTNEHATRPVGNAHEVVSHPVWCRPCMLRECPIDHRCMHGVSVLAVVDAARRTIR
ncbi:MAG TPA: lipopolysaccharide heptosyltransferase II [Vicinamibacterales bacterium]|nr:lipopolysaccharide heptosyltransferase II [Vicinamibacterales bacterium]